MAEVSYVPQSRLTGLRQRAHEEIGLEMIECGAHRHTGIKV